jgi:hypothetical protein
VPDFIVFMHNDAPDRTTGDWGAYLAGLRAAGVFEGGSAIGAGECMRKTGTPAPLAEQLDGYIRVTAPSLAAARTLIEGNPAYEAGATIEIRELPRDE